jgi:predicted permease
MVFTDTHYPNRGNHWLQSVARLKPGATLAQAQAEMDTIAARLAKAYPDSNSEGGVRLAPLAKAGRENGRRLVWLVLGLAGFVLLIACANLANLQLARTASRARELAIRGALGASRGRLLGQLLTESLLIALLGGLLGLVLAGWGNQWLGRQMKWGNELGVKLPLDLAAIGYALGASALAGAVFGLAPAWLASGANVNDVLKQGARGATGGRSVSRWQHSLIVAEVALALVLLSAAGLVIRGLQRFASHDPGWRVEGLTFGYVNLPEVNYGAVNRRFAFAEQLQEKLRALPGVEGVALAWFLPIRGFDVSSSFVVEGRPEPPKGHEPIHLNNVVTPSYFRTLGMRLVTGRDFTNADTTNRPAVVIINEAMARAFWPGESPLGKRIGGADDWQEIVGVVSDVRFPGEIDEPMTGFQTYTPFAQWTPGNLALAVRGRVATETMRRIVSELDPDLPVNDAGPASVAVGQSQSEGAVTGWLLGGFATLGLLLAALGIYGVIAGFVAQRTNEIGVRMALGAQLGDVLWLVLGKGLRLTAMGVGLGFLGALAVERLLASVSTELEAKSPMPFVCVAALLVAVAMFACWLPARRAARVDPMVALRNE